MEATQGNAAQRGRSLFVRFATWPFKGKGWRRWARLIVVLLGLYNLYTCVTLRRPPIHGVVFDASTGMPIAGVEVFAAARFTIFAPVETAENQVGGGAYCVTDSQGRFSMPACSCVWWEPVKDADAPDPRDLAIPKWMNNLEMRLWGKDYVTQNLGGPPSWFIPYFTPPTENPTFSRWRLPVAGYFYRIVLRAPEDESSWEEKCRETERAAPHLPDEIAGRWLFNDLTGYLERWPAGEKAPNYFSELLGTGYIASCDYLQGQWATGAMTRDTLAGLFARNQRILQLAQNVTMQREPIRAKVEQGSLQEMRDLTLCIERLLQQQAPKRGR